MLVQRSKFGLNELLGCTGCVREPGTGRCEGQCVRSRAACFSCVRRRASNAILHESAGQRHAGEGVAGAMNDHRGPAHKFERPDAREPCVRSLRWTSRTQTTRHEFLERNAGLLRYTCELLLCNLTPELSRLAKCSRHRGKLNLPRCWCNEASSA